MLSFFEHFDLVSSFIKEISHSEKPPCFTFCTNFYVDPFVLRLLANAERVEDIAEERIERAEID